MEEKIREEFNKPWDIDEDAIELEKREKRDLCIKIIKDILESEWEIQEKLSEIESVIKSTE